MTIPNWNKDKHYDFVEELTFSGWAWEFLRRSKDYRKSYTDYLAQSKKLEHEFGPNWLNSEKCRYYDPPRNEGEDSSKWTIRCGLELGIRGRVFSLDKYLGKNFGLDGMFDPTVATSEEVNFLPPSSYPQLIEKPEDLDDFLQEVETYDPISNDVDGGAVTILDRDFAVLVFDLSLSAETQSGVLTGQLATIRKERNLTKPRLPSKKAVEWRRYLRVLDADLSGTKIPEIASVIWSKPTENHYPDEQAQSALKNARKWTNPIKYTRLLYW